MIRATGTIGQDIEFDWITSVDQAELQNIAVRLYRPCTADGRLTTWVNNSHFAHNVNSPQLGYGADNQLAPYLNEASWLLRRIAGNGTN